MIVQTSGPVPFIEAELAAARRYSMVIAWSNEDEVYVVSVPGLPPTMRTHGSTVAEAEANGETMITDWLESRRERGLPAPAPSPAPRRLVPDGAPRYDAAAIRAIRERTGLSQPLFAGALNVSPATIRAWEQGARVPDGASARLLEIADRHPEVLFRELPVPA